MQGGSREERRVEGWTESEEVVGKSTGLRNRQKRMNRGKDGVVNNGWSVLRP